jgi:hypothetical protein
LDVWQGRGISEAGGKGGAFMSNSIVVKGGGSRLSGDANPMTRSGLTKPNYRNSTRNGSEYNPRWGHVHYKVVRDVDTSGGKFQQPLIQQRHKLYNTLGFCKPLCLIYIT